MSRPGNCYDNAVAERFFWSLKHEWTKHEIFADLAAAQRSVFKYIETFDNSLRLHQTLGYKSLNQLRPGPCGVNSSPVTVRKWWAIAP